MPFSDIHIFHDAFILPANLPSQVVKNFSKQNKSSFTKEKPRRRKKLTFTFFVCLFSKKKKKKKKKMQITVTTLSGDVFPLEVPEDLELENFKAFCEAESGIASQEMIILFNGKPLLDDKKTLKEYNVKNGDMVVMEKVRKDQPKRSPSASSQGRITFKKKNFKKSLQILC